MKKFILVFNFGLIMLISYPLNVWANIVCNDGTISPSCSDCHRGCCSKHGGCSSNGSSSFSGGNTYSSSNKKPASQEQPKSSDTTLKKVTIDNENIPISNNMVYSTTKEGINLLVLANDSKAKVEYPNKVNLIDGKNVISILVTAENGNVKKYNLNITKEKILSNNKNIKIFVNSKEIIFANFKSEVINVNSNENSIDITYDLEDSNANVEIIGNNNLKVGYNEIIVKVIAENKEEQEYVIVVEKEEYEINKGEVKDNETELDTINHAALTYDMQTKKDENSFLFTCLLFGFCSSLVCFVYKKLKK